jgi:hypothetical protein
VLPDEGLRGEGEKGKEEKMGEKREKRKCLTVVYAG